MTGEIVAASIEEIQNLMRDRLRVRGSTLARQIDRTGRLLPRAIAREARYLAQAETLVQNPKLVRMVDPARLSAAREKVAAYLRGVDPDRRRRDRLLGMLGLVSFQILVIGAALVAWLVWRGIV